MYSTSLKTWARTIGIDSILIGALVAGVIFHTPYALEVSVFFMWWISILGLVFGLIAKAEEGSAKLWSVKMVNRLAASNTYLTYHWLTDIAVWVLLIIAGHPILATFKVASFLVSCMLIGVARRLYRVRLDQLARPDPKAPPALASPSAPAHPPSRPAHRRCGLTPLAETSASTL